MRTWKRGIPIQVNAALFFYLSKSSFKCPAPTGGYLSTLGRIGDSLQIRPRSSVGQSQGSIISVHWTVQQYGVVQPLEALFKVDIDGGRLRLFEAN